MPMNRLKDHSTYLIGPMDRVADRGRGWRDEITPFLKELEIGVFNPAKKATNKACEVDDAFTLRKKAMNEGDYDKVREIMKEVVSYDLRMVDLCDFIIMYVDTDVHMCGTYNEQFLACMQRKPVICFCKQAKKRIPDWLYGILDHNLFFDSLDEVKEYIRHIAFDEVIKNSGKWKFFDYSRIYS